MLSAFADDTQTDWPEPVYFPQAQIQQGDAASAAKQSKQGNAASEPKKKGWFAKRREKKQPPPTDEQITQVGPKDPPPSPYPLLRLPMPIQTATGVIGPGIYLVKPAQRTAEAATNTAGDPIISLILTRQNRAVLAFQAHPSAQPDENKALTGTESPLTRTAPAAAPITKVEAQVSEDLKTLTIVITENEKRFESDPFPVNIDTRHILTY
jgi:hypothetical protein